MGSLHLERLEALIHSGITASEPELKIVLDHLYADLIHRRSRSSLDSADYFGRTLHALEKIKGIGNSQIRLACFHQCCGFLLHHGNLVTALEAAEQYHSLAVRAQAIDGVTKSLNLRGMVNGELGNLNEAIVQYAEALCIARREGDLESAGIVINNLGCALNYAGLYLEAIPCFTRVIAVAQPGWTFRAD